MIFNGSIGRRSNDHIPITLLTISNSEVYYQWFLTALFVDRPFVAFGVYNPYNRLAVMGEINLLPLFQMDINGARIMQNQSFVGKMKASKYLMLINKFKDNKIPKHRKQLFGPSTESQQILFEMPDTLNYCL